MTLCNMSIEGGARVGYVNPDQKTFDYLTGREFAPKGEAWDEAVAWWRALASDADASYDDVVRIDAADIAPTVTWGINPGQAIGVKERVPRVEDGKTEAEQASITEALDYMKLEPAASRSRGQGGRGLHRQLHQRPPLRLPRGRAPHQGPQGGARRARARRPRLAGGRAPAEAEGLDRVFREAGFEWREAGCSMCLAMNPDKLVGAAALRVVLQPQLQGPAGQPDRPHRADEPADGGRRGDPRLTSPTPAKCSRSTDRLQARRYRQWHSKRSPGSPAAPSTSPATTSTPTASSRRAS